HPLVVAYWSCRKRAPASGGGKRTKWTWQGGKRQGNGKKMLFLRNEPTDLVQTRDLAFSNAKNELVFERKKGQTKPKKGPKNAFCGASKSKLSSRRGQVSGRAQGGYTSFEFDVSGIRNPPGTEPRSGKGGRSRQM